MLVVLPSFLTFLRNIDNLALAETKWNNPETVTLLKTVFLSITAIAVLSAAVILQMSPLCD